MFLPYGDVLGAVLMRVGLAVALATVKPRDLV